MTTTLTKETTMSETTWGPWTPHEGRECPVCAGTIVEVLHHDGTKVAFTAGQRWSARTDRGTVVSGDGSGSEWVWGARCQPAPGFRQIGELRIVAYRVEKPVEKEVDTPPLDQRIPVLEARIRVLGSDLQTTLHERDAARETNRRLNRRAQEIEAPWQSRAHIAENRASEEERRSRRSERQRDILLGFAREVERICGRVSDNPTDRLIQLRHLAAKAILDQKQVLY